MKLFFVTPQLPYPPRQGTAIRNWGLMRHLSDRHEVGYVSFVGPGQTLPPPTAGGPRLLGTAPQPPWPVASRLRALLLGQPDLARRLWSPEFAHVLRRALEQFAPYIVQMEGLELAAYLADIRRAAPDGRVVYDAHNAEHLIQRRAWQNDRRRPRRWPAAVYSVIQERLLARLEASVCAQVAAVTVVSSEDAAALRRLAPAVQPELVPNGIAAAAYMEEDVAPPAPMGLCDLVFTGKMDYRPNLDAALWFADEILPLIRAHRPEARLVIVGQQPPAALLQRGQQPEITVTGAVEDTRPYIAGAAVYVAPLRMGGGTRFKLLEAMAMARPVVSTRLGAEGFAVENGRELILADGPEALAAACLRVLADAGLARRLGRAGHEFVQAHHDWGIIVPRLERLYMRLGGT